MQQQLKSQLYDGLFRLVAEQKFYLMSKEVEGKTEKHGSFVVFLTLLFVGFIYKGHAGWKTKSNCHVARENSKKIVLQGPDKDWVGGQQK